MVCVAAPPSDQETNSYVVPFSVWVAGAPSVLRIPVTPATDRLDVNGVPSSVSVSPGTLERMVIVAVRGVMSRDVDWVSPFESVTVRWTRYHTSVENSPVRGIVNEPDRTPVVPGTKGGGGAARWEAASTGQ